MQQFIVSFMDQFGYFGILFLIMIENLFPPIPSEVILAFGGFMTTYSSMNVLGVVVFSTLGSLIGAVVLYFIGYVLNKDRLSKILSGRIGKILHFKSSDVERADGMFLKSGNKTVLFCRFVPIVRSLISIPAGMAKMPFLAFMFYTTCGTIVWNTVLVVVGRMLGSNWVKLVEVINEYSSITVIVLSILLGVMIFYKLFFKKRLKTT